MTHGFLSKNDSTEELVLQAFERDGEINDGSSGRYLGGEGGVWQFGGQVQGEAFHQVTLLVPDFHLQCGAHLARERCDDNCRHL